MARNDNTLLAFRFSVSDFIGDCGKMKPGCGSQRVHVTRLGNEALNMTGPFLRGFQEVDSTRGQPALENIAAIAVLDATNDHFLRVAL